MVFLTQEKYERVGFQSVNNSALESLVDIVVTYVKDLGNTVKFDAGIANRTECNVFNLIQSLEDSCSSIGFPGGLKFCSNLVRSSSMKDAMEYVEAIEELPFAQPVSTFPIVRNRRLTPSFLQMGETPEFKHVLDWLPAFPDLHTYIHSLLSCQKEHTNDVHMENHVSILEAFSPVIEVLNSRVSELGENGERDVVNKRPVVRLNFSNGKKLIGVPWIVEYGKEVQEGFHPGLDVMMWWMKRRE
ncbi:hypothetical protein L1887_09534 [Cichorium endivia]|nr:hypothetical protein L1887_09534 [Cichorium endivia]